METNKVSADTEKRLTRAIEKAATLASVNEDIDKDTALAEQLQAEGVDAKFAKIAAHAFNKRFTVMKLQKTADEHKAEPFGLVDADKVYELMGGEVQQAKTASVQSGPYVIDFASKVTMTKTASKPEYKKPLYEDTVSTEVFQEHVSNLLAKQAAKVSELTGMWESLDSSICAQKEELAKYFQKTASSSFEFMTLKNVYGDAFKEALEDVLPPTTDFSKTASAAILPNGYIYTKTAKLLSDIQARKDLGDFIGYYSKGLTEFCKTAGELGNAIAKAKFHGLYKEAAGRMLTGLGSVLTGVGLTGLQAGQSAADYAKSVGGAYATGIENAVNKYNAGNNVALAPGAVLDSQFLIKDRFRDRLLGWSDMSADPQFAMYPAEQLFAATQKAMDMDTSLERPDRREVLRAHVGQLLAQNNRASTADVAALASTLKSLSGGAGSAADIAAMPVKGMEKVDAPQIRPEQKSMLEHIPESSIGKAIEALQGVLVENERKQDKLDEEDRKREEAEAKRLSDAEAREEQQMIADKKRREDRAYAEHQKQEGRDYAEAQAQQRELLNADKEHVKRQRALLDNSLADQARQMERTRAEREAIARDQVKKLGLTYTSNGRWVHQGKAGPAGSTYDLAADVDKEMAKRDALRNI